MSITKILKIYFIVRHNGINAICTTLLCLLNGMAIDGVIGVIELTYKAIKDSPFT